jgi:hypothetical protein
VRRGLDFSILTINPKCRPSMQLPKFYVSGVTEGSRAIYADGYQEPWSAKLPVPASRMERVCDDIITGSFTGRVATGWPLGGRCMPRMVSRTVSSPQLRSPRLWNCSIGPLCSMLRTCKNPRVTSSSRWRRIASTATPHPLACNLQPARFPRREGLTSPKNGRLLVGRASLTAPIGATACRGRLPDMLKCGETVEAGAHPRIPHR